MTAPDHTPYLLATDLRTPEDVLAWFRVQPRYPFEGDLVLALAERLDRERRQACRRGALENWRAFVDSHGVRTGRRRKCLLSLIPFTAYREACAQELHIPSGAYRDWALAFRAAARQP